MQLAAAEGEGDALRQAKLQAEFTTAEAHLAELTAEWDEMMGDS